MLPFFLFPRRYSVCVNTYGNHIAIIGGGIAGLALGIMLKKNNILKILSYIVAYIVIIISVILCTEANGLDANVIGFTLLIAR